jgi:hypothetical protein
MVLTNSLFLKTQGHLVISAVGYGNIEAAITGTTVDVGLTASQSNLNEVVVVGYGTAGKGTLRVL